MFDITSKDLLLHENNAETIWRGSNLREYSLTQNYEVTFWSVL